MVGVAVPVGKMKDGVAVVLEARGKFGATLVAKMKVTIDKPMNNTTMIDPRTTRPLAASRSNENRVSCLSERAAKISRTVNATPMTQPM